MASSTPGKPIISLPDIAFVLRRNVKVESHTGGLFGLKTFRETFTGAAAISSLVSQGFAHTREEASRLGNSLVAAGYIRHVKDGRQPLKDKPTSLYR